MRVVLRCSSFLVCVVPTAQTRLRPGQQTAAASDGESDGGSDSDSDSDSDDESDSAAVVGTCSKAQTVTKSCPPTLRIRTSSFSADSRLSGVEK